MNSQKTWSSGATECRAWIGNCNVKVWKSTEHKLHKIWHSLKFCTNWGKRAHPWVRVWVSYLSFAEGYLFSEVGHLRQDNWMWPMSLQNEHMCICKQIKKTTSDKVIRDSVQLMFLSSRGRVWVHHLSLSSGPLLERWSAVAATTNHCSSSGFFPATHLHTQTKKKPGSATAGMKMCGGLWQNSGGELKLYLGCTESTETQMGNSNPFRRLKI